MKKLFAILAVSAFLFAACNTAEEPKKDGDKAQTEQKDQKAGDQQNQQNQQDQQAQQDDQAQQNDQDE